MTTYYKATRPNGTSFHDGVTRWEVGETVKIKVMDRRKTMCGKGILHASDAPGETLVNGTWPCRLFEVEGEPIAQGGHKLGFHELTVVRELPAWQVFGPNGEAVVELIEQAARMTEDEVARMNDPYAARDAARDAAWNASHAAWIAAWNAWIAAWNASHAAWYAARYAARDTARVAAWNAARDAARYAAAALVVRDLISEEDFQILYRPWASVMEAM